jgi:uncharacterized protein (TIGR02246 family)
MLGGKGERPMSGDTTRQDDEAAVRALYAATIAGWNHHDAAAQAAPFAEDGEVLGFDGSEMAGRADIQRQLAAIFKDHVTAPYTVKVKGVRFLGADVAVLRAMVGMAPNAETPLRPATNAWQTLVAERRGGRWEIVLFQNTPAQFHGRPELVEAMTAELEAVRKDG